MPCTTPQGVGESAERSVTSSGTTADIRLTNVTTNTTLNLKQLTRNEQVASFPSGENTVSAEVMVNSTPSLVLNSNIDGSTENNSVKFPQGTTASQVIERVVNQSESTQGTTFSLIQQGENASSEPFNGNTALPQGVFIYDIVFDSEVSCQNTSNFNNLLYIEIEAEPVLTVRNNDVDNSVAVFPTVSTGQVLLRINNKINSEVNIVVTNSSAQVVARWTKNKSNELFELPLEMNYLPAGLYIIEIVIENQRWTKKIILN